jgi:hypothetical protein
VWIFGLCVQRRRKKERESGREREKEGEREMGDGRAIMLETYEAGGEPGRTDRVEPGARN